MDIAATPLNDILAEFESHWIGREVEGSQYLPAEAAFFRGVVRGVLRRSAHARSDDRQGARRRLAAQARRGAAARGAARRRVRARRRAPTCRRASWSPNMSTSRTPSSTRTRPAWSTRCSTSSRGNCAPASSAGSGVGRRGATRGSAEDRLIAHYFKPLAKHPGAFGLPTMPPRSRRPPGHDLVLKTDGLIAGVHFFPDDPADGVARKALRVNLSDLAAKGATPLGFLLAIALPKGFSEDWLAAFARGLGEDAERYGCPLLGGDTDSTPGPITISISAFGTLPQGTMVAAQRARRSAITCSSPARSAMRRSACGCVSDAGAGESLEARRRDARPSGRALSRAAAAQRARRRRCARMHRPRWTSRTGSPAISRKLCRASNVVGRHRGRARAAVGGGRARARRPSRR